MGHSESLKLRSEFHRSFNTPIYQKRRLPLIQKYRHSWRHTFAETIRKTPYVPKHVRNSDRSYGPRTLREAIYLALT